MEQIADVDLFEDRALLARIARWSAGMLVAGLVPLACWALAGMPCEELGPAPLLWCALLCLGALPVHELVHAAFFLALGGPGTRVRFGARQGMLYAEAPGLVLPAARFVVVLLAPMLLVSAAILALGIWALGMPVAALVAFATHLSGCAGDVVFACLVRELRATSVADSPHGIVLFG
jgi:hypothetical protein